MAFQDINQRKRLLTGTLPVNNSLLTGTVPVNYSLLTGTVPVNYSLLTGMVPVNKSLLTGTVPVNSLLLTGTLKGFSSPIGKLSYSNRNIKELPVNYHLELIGWFQLVTLLFLK